MPTGGVPDHAGRNAAGAVTPHTSSVSGTMMPATSAGASPGHARLGLPATDASVPSTMPSRTVTIPPAVSAAVNGNRGHDQPQRRRNRVSRRNRPAIGRRARDRRHPDRHALHARRHDFDVATGVDTVPRTIVTRAPVNSVVLSRGSHDSDRALERGLRGDERALARHITSPGPQLLGGHVQCACHERREQHERHDGGGQRESGVATGARRVATSSVPHADRDGHASPGTRRDVPESASSDLRARDDFNSGDARGIAGSRHHRARVVEIAQHAARWRQRGASTRRTVRSPVGRP